MKATLYTTEGKENGSIDLNEKVFGLPWNNALVAQAARVQQMNAYFPWAHTKGRGDVSGGGKKPWKQKGTGRARQGSIRAPQWKGGGVVFGPNALKKRTLAISDAMRRKALLTVLSQKLRDGELRVMESLGQTKTKEAERLVATFAKPRKAKKYESVLFALEGTGRGAVKSFRNLAYGKAIEARNLNVLDLLNHKYLVVTQKGAEEIASTFAKK